MTTETATTTSASKAVYSNLETGQVRGRTKFLLFLALLTVVVLFTTFPLWSSGRDTGTPEAPELDTADVDPGLETQVKDDVQNSIQSTNGSTHMTGGAQVDSKNNAKGISAIWQATQNVQVAWIMSFGGSGTSYTIMNTEHMTGTTTATNYGRDLNPCLPVHANETNGPFLHSPMQLDIPPPSSYMLTKTHCGGYCMDCAPGGYILTPEEFETSCVTGHKPAEATAGAGGDGVVAGSWTPAIYDTSIPKKAVHLVRNPFDNLVARMHLGTAKRSSSSNRNDQVGTSTDDDSVASNNSQGAFNSSKASFDNWCKTMDHKMAARENHSPLINHTFWNMYKGLPCHAEWFRYFQWHNLALQVTRERLNLPTFYLFYHNYTDHYEETISALYTFLNLQVQPGVAPIEFSTGHDYANYYDDTSAILATRMAMDMASPELWQLIQHYFTPWIPRINEVSVDAAPAVMMGGDDQAPTEQAQTPVLDFKYDYRGNKNAQVAWLMSFPNSGTSYTIDNTERMTNATTATNYAQDFDYCIPVRPELTTGPFVHKLQMTLPSTVLTKTHCAGFCEDCDPTGYILTANAFEMGCRTVDMNVNGAMVRTTYNASVVTKAVHLIRNPFDNVVARMHLALERRKQAGWTDAQLASISNMTGWCHYVDSMFAKQEASIESFTRHQKGLLNDMPCHADWFRYVQWHNLAINTTKQLGIPVHFLYYEDYGTDFMGTTRALFDFLGVHMLGHPIAFEAGHSYMNLYDSTMRTRAKRLVQSFATPETWALVGKYFVNITA